MLFHTEEWTINLVHVASIEWDDEYKDAEVFMNDGRSYTVGECDDFDRLAAVVGRNNTLSQELTINLGHVASIKWDDEYKDAEVFMNNGRSYTVGECDDIDLLAAAVGRNNTLSETLQDQGYLNPDQIFRAAQVLTLLGDK